MVFSQFTSFMDLIQTALEREGIDQYRFDGTMDVKKKNAAISQFKSHSQKPKVLVISLKAGGVGLNVSLTTSMITGIWLDWYILVDHRKPCVYGMKLFLLLFYHSSVPKSRWIVGGTQQLKTKVNIFHRPTIPC